MKTILVIEDDTVLRETLRQFLAQKGFEALSAADGSSGLQVALARVPDAVLTDLSLDGLSGLEILRELRRNPATASTPCILMTGLLKEDALQEGILCQASGYLVKPFSFDKLLAALAFCFDKSPDASPPMPDFSGARSE